MRDLGTAPKLVSICMFCFCFFDVGPPMLPLARCTAMLPPGLCQLQGHRYAGGVGIRFLGCPGTKRHETVSWLKRPKQKQRARLYVVFVIVLATSSAVSSRHRIPLPTNTITDHYMHLRPAVSSRGFIYQNCMHETRVLEKTLLRRSEYVPVALSNSPGLDRLPPLAEGVVGWKQSCHLQG